MHRGRQRPKFKTKSYGTTRYTKNKYTVKSTVSGTAVAGLEGGMTQEDEFQTSIGGTTEDQQLPTTALFEKYAVINAMDLQMGFVDHSSNVPKRGWLINIQTNLHETCEFLKKRYGNLIEGIERAEKEDLSLKNHLASERRTYIKVLFRNVEDMTSTKRSLLAALATNKQNGQHREFQSNTIAQLNYDSPSLKCRARTVNSGLNGILEIREHDIPYQLRVCIDLGIRTGIWYNVWTTPQTAEVPEKTHAIPLEDQPVRPDPVILAFDIETTKQPLRFPTATSDVIMMISYMIDGNGYLIVNREVVSEDIPDFEYSPKPEFRGLFQVSNVSNEHLLLERFIAHIQQSRPTILVSYNGDFFDWPFIEARCIANGIDFHSVLGIYRHGPSAISGPVSELSNDGDDSAKRGPLPYYSSTWATHMDVFKWVKRDSYLPAGSQGLKSVTSIKLGYIPLELDPEEMLVLAHKDPQKLAAYSVSDALCTYHLYIKYVHPFIFSLSSIIPLSPDDVLRKGTGALCETLLMAEAFQAHIIMPDKTLYGTDNVMTPDGKHLVDTETYVGGHVESLESGVFRSDLPVQFKMDVDTLHQLDAELREAILFSLSSEHGIMSEEIDDLDSILEGPKRALAALMSKPNFEAKPLIYHLDVAAMYPNIILTNRLQPPSVINEEACALCDHNRPGMRCQRLLEWSWRGEHFVAQKNEIKMIQNQLSGETFLKGGKNLKWGDLSPTEQNSIFKKRLSSYCRKVYNKIHSTSVEKRTSIVCQRENSFYVDTVKRFRDRRYEYKTLHKGAKKALEKSFTSPAALEEARKFVVLYDSLQLAHKVILNSFYGYVMKKGSRWYSMEMAGIVCETGASIIRLARQWMEKLGRPLELDTDGIWLMLPSPFPDQITIKLVSGKSITLSYPCVLLNKLVHSMFTNDQYHLLLSSTLSPPMDRQYEIKSENSIFFEIDGPYRAMILPASTDEDRLLKKRYAVFSSDGSLAELKGFEVKRRGELRLTKLFQSELFSAYLEGSTLPLCYEHVSRVASRWLDLLDSKAKLLSDHELFELVTESRTMSKPLSHYTTTAKSPALTTAKRLSEFLGSGILSGEGTMASLTCAYVIANGSSNFSVAERAIPVTIWAAEPEIREFYLTTWIKSISGSTSSLSLHDVLDWAYYKERFMSLVLKLIVIPAAMQGIANPFGKRVQAPSWLMQSVKHMSSNGKKTQQLLKDSWKTPITNSSSFDERSPMMEKPVCNLTSNTEAIDKSNQTPRHELLYSSYKGWLQGMRLRWASINAAKKRRGARWLIPSLHQGPCSVLGISLVPGERKFRIWLLPLHCNRKGGPLSGLQRFDIEIPEAFSFCVEVEKEGISSFLEYCRLKHWAPLYEENKAPYSVLTDGSTPEGTLLWVTRSTLDTDPMFHQSVLGTYEKANPLFKALLEVGAVVRGSTSICDRRDDLCNMYLQAKFPIIFVFHNQHKHSNFLLLLAEAQSSFKAIIISSGIETMSKTNAEKIALSMGLNISSFTIDTVPNTKQLSNLFLQYLSTHHGATTALLVIQSNSELLSKSMDLLERPILWRHLENLGPLDISQALALSQYLLKESFRSFLSLQSWLNDELEICRTLNVPLCRQNLLQDQWTNLDVAYVRSLRAAGRVFSTGLNSGCFNAGDYLAIQSSLLEAKNSSLNVKPLLGVSLHAFQERPVPSQKGLHGFLNQPGFYENVCFRLKVNAIFICAILEASVLIPPESIDANDKSDNHEPGTPMGNPKLNCHIGMEDVSSPILRRMNRVIKETLKSEALITSSGALPMHTTQGRHSISPLMALVGQLLKKQAQGMAGPAFILNSFDNWISNPSGMASNLLGSIYQLQQKLLLQLISELNRLGLTVVMLGNHQSFIDSFSLPLLISTNKSDASSALYHLNWAIGELSKTPGLCWLDLNLIIGWKRLLWMDQSNYYGELLSSEATTATVTIASAPTDWKWNFAAKLLPQDAAAWATRAILLIFDGFSAIFPTSEEEPQFNEKMVMNLFGLIQEFTTTYDDKENSSPHVSMTFSRLVSMLLSIDARISMAHVNGIGRSLLALASGTNVIDSSLKGLHLFDETHEVLSVEDESAFAPIKCDHCTLTTTVDLANGRTICLYCHLMISESQLVKAICDHLQILRWNVCSASNAACFECHACGSSSNRSISKWCPKCTKAYTSSSTMNWKNANLELERFQRIISKRLQGLNLPF